jgi:hypothetical protein
VRGAAGTALSAASPAPACCDCVPLLLLATQSTVRSRPLVIHTEKNCNNTSIFLPAAFLLQMSANPPSSQPDASAPARWRAKLRPSLSSSSSALVFAAHAVMLDAGFTCAGTVSFEPNSAPLPSNWAQDAHAYVFHYQHPSSSPRDAAFVLKVPSPQLQLWLSLCR